MRTARVLQVPRMEGPALNTEIPYIPGSVIPILGAWDVRNTGDALANAGIRVTLLADGAWGDHTKLVLKEDGIIDDTLNLIASANVLGLSDRG